MKKFNPELFSLAMSDDAKPLLEAVKRHISENVDPITEEFYALNKEKEDIWSHHPRQIELLEGAKKKAKESGLWNFFLPDAETGEGLKNLDTPVRILSGVVCGPAAVPNLRQHRRRCYTARQ